MNEHIANTKYAEVTAPEPKIRLNVKALGEFGSWLLTYPVNPSTDSFLRSIHEQARRYGTITERQYDAVYRIYVRDLERSSGELNASMGGREKLVELLGLAEVERWETEIGHPLMTAAELETDALAEWEAMYRNDMGREEEYCVPAPSAAPAIETPAAAPSHAAVTRPSVPNGYYTVKGADGTHSTFRLRAGWTAEHKRKGTQVIGLLVGSDNTGSYVNFGFVDGRFLHFWKNARVATKSLHRAQFLIDGTDESVTDAGKLYAMESGNCYRCGKLLTEPESIESGLGPICRGKAAF